MGLLDRFRGRDDDGVDLAPPAAPPAFPLARGKGYRRDQVDAFLAGAASLRADEIAAVRFETQRHGYEVDAVDDALDALEMRAAREVQAAHEPGAATSADESPVALPSSFPVVPWGYRRDQVDAFLARAGSMSWREIREVQFESARRGYEMTAVDDALDLLDRQARDREAASGQE